LFIGVVTKPAEAFLAPIFLISPNGYVKFVSFFYLRLFRAGETLSATEYAS
jgi:hypothetical protein